MGFLKWLAKRAITMAITLVIAVYITVIIANMGGLVDEIVMKQIEAQVSEMLRMNPRFMNMTLEEREEYRQRLIAEQIKARGLDKPPIIRSFYYLRDALTLDLGRTGRPFGQRRVWDVIMERLPWSVLLFTTATVINAAIGIPLGLYMGRKALSKFDRGMMLFAILTYSLPAWFVGMLLILVFYFYLGWFPAGQLVSGMYKSYWTPEAIADIMWHMALPLMSWVITGFGGWAYTTRNIVIHITHEDYVLVARAKGVPERLIIRRYILRPAAPPIVTMIALALIGSWGGAIITETVFQWPGLGQLYWWAISTQEASLVIGITVIYAYLLVITVFVLNILYGFLDPRIKAMR